MPKTTFQRVIFTCLGVLFMATTMATYNKYLVIGHFSAEFWRQVAIAFCQKAPLAFILQFFFVQKFAAKNAAKYPTDNQIVYQCIRAGFTVLVMCPIMCAYSNLIVMFQYHLTFLQFLENFVTKIPVNWIFAYMVQIFLLGPWNRFLFRTIFKKQLAK